MALLIARDTGDIGNVKFPRSYRYTSSPSELTRQIGKQKQWGGSSDYGAPKGTGGFGATSMAAVEIAVTDK
jgi:hypothetical protein